MQLLPELDRVRAEDLGLVPHSAESKNRRLPLSLDDGRTLLNELTTLKQTVKWLIQQGHLNGMEPIELKVCKAESQPAYCYRPAEAKAMLELCRKTPDLHWLADIITALACTGLRIAELASLRWADIDLQSERITLTDETGRPGKSDRKRRQKANKDSRTEGCTPSDITFARLVPTTECLSGLSWTGSDTPIAK